MANPRHEQIREGDLHNLTDDDYFDALAQMPPVYDADGNEVGGLFDDVQDKRAEKRGDQ
jgi:hypothetical protein